MIEVVTSMWRDWACTGEGEVGADAGTESVSVVDLGAARFVRAPIEFHVMALESRDIDDLVARLGERVARVVGAAHLAYRESRVEGDDRPVEFVEAGDSRLWALEASVDRREWLEAGADEPADLYVVAESEGHIAALATARHWTDRVGHIGVVTDPSLRRSGLGTAVAVAATNRIIESGGVAQWRSRVDNTASAALAAKLGYRRVGSQYTVRVRTG